MHSILHQHKNLKLDPTSNQASQSTTTLAFHRQPIDIIIGGFPFLSSITNADVTGVMAPIHHQRRRCRSTLEKTAIIAEMVYGTQLEISGD
jgi:hypothetical protein